MNWAIKHKGIVITAFIGLFVFVSLAISGVLGNTQIGLTLRTNPELQRGLVGHWTFDANDVDGYNVIDSSGQGNDGLMVATSSDKNEYIFDGSASGNGPDHRSIAPRMAWTSDLNGYVGYVSGTEQIGFASTTDGGISWATSTIDTQGNTVVVGLWYDQWTPGDDVGTIIHIVYLQRSDDDIFYIQYDTSDDSVSTPVNITAGSGFSQGLTQQPVGITKAEDGTVFAGVAGGGDAMIVRCSAECTDASKWVEATGSFNNSTGFYRPVLLPIRGTNNIMNIYYNSGDVDFVSQIWNASSSSWEAVNVFDSGAQFPTVDGHGGAIHRTTGDIYFAVTHHTNDYVTEDHDIEMWKYTATSSAWSQLTNVATNVSGGLESVQMAVDQNNEGHLYVVYQRRTTIGDENTANIYYRWSTDDGATWTDEIGPLNQQTDEEIYGLGVNPIATNKVTVSYKYEDAPQEDDMYQVLVHDLGEFDSGFPVPGKIGQGLYFDGIDDVIDGQTNQVLPQQPTDTNGLSLAGWFKTDGTDVGEAYVIITPLGGYSFWLDEVNDDSICDMQDDDMGNVRTQTSGAFEAVDTFTHGKWTHFACVYSTSTKQLTLYLDGQEATSTDASLWDRFSMEEEFALGSCCDGTAGVFSGTIDDVRVYNRALSANDVQRLYDLGATTKINKTINTNPDLDDGLVGHWTFDASDVDGFDVIDRIGGNDGVVYATTSNTTEVEIDDSADNFDGRFMNENPTMVWVSDQEGYVFYSDTSANASVASTTDGGATWNTESLPESTSELFTSIWYDGWTPGDDGNLIHIAMPYITDPDDVLYQTYDTVTNTFSTAITPTTSPGISTQLDGEAMPSIVKTESGHMYIVVSDAADDGSWMVRCESNCTDSLSWSEVPFPFAEDDDIHTLLPVKGTDNIMFIFWDISEDDMLSNIYSATSSSWQGTTTINSSAEDNTIYHGMLMGSSYNRNTGDIYHAYVDDANGYGSADHDIEVWKWQRDTETWGQLTEPVTNDSGGIMSAKIVVDQNREGELYVVYGKRTTIGTNTSGQIYWRKSTDDGATWSAEQGPVNSTQDDMHAIAVDPIASNRVSVWWKYATGANEDDVQIETIEQIGDYSDEKIARGKIGQGMTFDGDDDYVAGNSPLTRNEVNGVSGFAWFRMNENGVVSNQAPAGWRSNFWYEVQNDLDSQCFHRGLTSGTEGTPTSGTADDIIKGEWYHVGCVFDPVTDTLTMYINGASSTSHLIPDFDVFNHDDPQDYRIGNRVLSNNAFDGLVDDVRAYNRALSEEEVQRLYQLGATTKINTTISTNPDLERGLVGHWTFDGKDVDISDVTGEVLDRSGNANTGNWLDHATTTTFGQVGQAITFDGIDDVIEAGSDSSLQTQESTLAAWIKINAFSGVTDVIASRSDTIFCCGIEWGYDQNGFLSFAYNDGAVRGWYRDTAKALSLHEWYHVAIVFDDNNSDEVTFYVDGVEGDSVSTTAGTVAHGPGDDFRIGFQGENGYFDGTMDDLRLYNRALSAEEILRLYQLGQ